MKAYKVRAFALFLAIIWPNSPVLAGTGIETAALADDRGIVLPLSDLVIEEELTPAQIGELQRTYQRGRKLLDEGEPIEALELFEEIIRTLPVREVMYGAAVAAWEAQRYSVARDYLTVLMASQRVYVEEANLLGLVLTQLGQREEAIVALERALTDADGHDDPLWRSIVSLNIGVAYLRLGQYGRAQKVVERVLEDPISQKEIWLRALAQANLAATALSMSDLETASAHNKAVLALPAKKAGADARRLALVNAAEIARIKGESSEASRLLQRAADEADKGGDRTMWAIALLRQASLKCQQEPDAPDGVKLLEEIGSVFETKGLLPEQSRLLREHARCATTMDDLDKAWRYIELSLSLLDEIDAPSERLRTWLQASGILADLQRPREALTYLERAIEAAQGLDDQSSIAEGQLIRGRIFLDNFEPALAQDAFEKGLSFFEDRKMEEMASACKVGLARCTALFGRSDDALKQIDALVDELEAKKRYVDGAVVWGQVAGDLMSTGAWEPCWRGARQGREVLRRAQPSSPEIEVRLARLEASCLSMDGRSEEALAIIDDEETRDLIQYNRMVEVLNKSIDLMGEEKYSEGITLLKPFVDDDNSDESLVQKMAGQLAYGLQVKAMRSEDGGDIDGATQMLEEALKYARRSGEVQREVGASLHLAQLLLIPDEDSERALGLLRGALAGGHELDDDITVYHASMLLGQALFSKMPLEAIEHLRLAANTAEGIPQERGNAARLHHDLGILLLEHDLDGGLDELIAAQRAYRDVGETEQADEIAAYIAAISEDVTDE